MGAPKAVAGSVLMGAGMQGCITIGMDAMVYRLYASIISFRHSCRSYSRLFLLAALLDYLSSEMRKLGSGWEKLARSRRDGACDPRKALHRHGRPPVSRPPYASGPVSRPLSISTLGTAGIAAVTFIVSGWHADVMADRRFDCPRPSNCRREAAAKRGVPCGASKA